MTQLCYPWDKSLHFLPPTLLQFYSLLFRLCCYSVLLSPCCVQPPKAFVSVRNDEKQMENRWNRGCDHVARKMCSLQCMIQYK